VANGRAMSTALNLHEQKPLMRVFSEWLLAHQSLRDFNFLTNLTRDAPSFGNSA
jgi:hypothetical protein